MTRIRTERLLLVAATPAAARADIVGPAALAGALGADVGPGWPPPLNDRSSQAWTARFAEERPADAGWGSWYVLLARDAAPPLAIGIAGFRGAPGVDGTVEIGYAFVDDHQRRGYATEAARALVDFAFADRRVRRVLAHTLPELTPSIRVLEKCGFHRTGPGDEPGTIRFEKERP